MRFLSYCGVLLLIACSNPGVEFRGVAGQSIDVQDMHFTVYVRGDDAQAVRTGVHWPPTIASVFPAALVAMSEVSGCTARPETIVGDAALMQAKLDC